VLCLWQARAELLQRLQAALAGDPLLAHRICKSYASKALETTAVRQLLTAREVYLGQVRGKEE
jgi:hypothetical protein